MFYFLQTFAQFKAQFFGRVNLPSKGPVKLYKKSNKRNPASVGNYVSLKTYYTRILKLI